MADPDELADIPPIDVAALAAMTSRAGTVVERLRERVFAPDSRKTLNLRFNVRTAAEMIGRSEKLIRDAEADGRLPEAEKDPESNRRIGYTLPQINRMRDVFGVRPWRGEGDPALVLAVQNFKGGVGKSTIVCHLAQYLALQGYRVCVIDCDSQGSTTSIFGLNPDVDIDEEEETLYPFFRHGGPQTLDYALRATYWDGVALIGANLGLYDAEYEFAARLASEDGRVLDRLRHGVASIADRFDVILLDPPPALGMISLSVLRAANALLVPAPPNNIDFASTVHFLRMMTTTLAQIGEQTGEAARYQFVKILATKLNETKSAHISIKRMMDAVFPQDMLATTVKDSAEIDNATANLLTVYEVTGPATRTETHQRCRAYLDAMGREIELLMRKTWPSHHGRLAQEGLI